MTLGFQDGICNECRGLPLEAHPRAPMHGRTSKIVRYYWREIYFETTKRLAALEIDPSRARFAHRERHDEIERAVIEEFKALHLVAPKYKYNESSAAQVLSRCGVEVVNLRARYSRDEDGARQIVSELGSFEKPEDLAAAHFARFGLESMGCESRPFHVLFGIYLWLLIQDPADELGQVVAFGNRTACEAGRQAEPIVTVLPRDFGRPGFGIRRASAIQEHFKLLEDDLCWLFDYWLGPSADLRQYLWAHREDDVERARRLIQVLPHSTVRRVLRYLVASYWAHYTGWPDLLSFDANTFLFVEVKGSGDKLREDQKRWIQDNADTLKLPFKLVRVHREREAR